MASTDRLPLVEAQCQSYRGPLSAALHLAFVMDRNATRSAAQPGTARAAASKAGGSVTRRHRARARLLYGMDAAGGHGAVGGPPANDAAAAAAEVEEQNKAELANARALMQALFDRMESQPSSCELRLLLFVERTSDRQLAAIMPTNAMRNAAMLAVQTPLAAMLDADLGISANFSNLVADPRWIEFVMDPTGKGEPVLRILPAWETNTKLDNATASVATDAALSGSKKDVADMWANSTLQVFHADGCRMCHGAIRHNRWVTAITPYFVDYGPFFEPWCILRRHEDPGYDERFRGWCFDKIQHVEAMGRLRKYKLVVLPDAWLVHRHHEKAAIAAMAKPDHYGKQPQANKSEHYQAMVQPIRVGKGRSVSAYTHYRIHVDKLFQAERALVNASQYDPQLSPQFRNCRQVLPWWQGFGRDVGAAAGAETSPGSEADQDQEQLQGKGQGKALLSGQASGWGQVQGQGEPQSQLQLTALGLPRPLNAR